MSHTFAARLCGLDDLHSVRAKLADWLRARRHAPDIVAAAQLIVSELVANGVEHARASSLNVDVDDVDGRITLCVDHDIHRHIGDDIGGGVDEHDVDDEPATARDLHIDLHIDLRPEMPPPSSPRSRGLPIVRALATELRRDERHDGRVSITAIIDESVT